MWLQDLLPADLQSIRVMTYGYNSSLTRDTVEQTFVDYRRSFIHALMDARSKVEVNIQPRGRLASRNNDANSCSRDQSYSLAIVWVVF